MRLRVDIEAIVRAEQRLRARQSSGYQAEMRPRYHYEGSALFLATLAALGSDLKPAQPRESQQGRLGILHDLLRLSRPAESESADTFRAEVEQLGISRAPWLAALYLAPQWSEMAVTALGWPDVADMVWWLRSQPPPATMLSTYPYDRLAPEWRQYWQLWRTAILNRTSLLLQDLADGEVDVVWFERAYSKMGSEWWQTLRSQLSADSRAVLCADAILGDCDLDLLGQRLLRRRYQDAARAIGLAPLASHQPLQDLRERYEVLRAFLRSQRGGVERRVNEQRVVGLALKYLARQAGFADAALMTWQLEAAELNELARPAISQIEPYEIRYEVDEQGRPQLQASRAGRPLKQVPRQVRQEPAVKDLLARQKTLQERLQAAAGALENGMVEGVIFAGLELERLMAITPLGAILSRLVLGSATVYGLPEFGGNELGLRDHDGRRHPLPAELWLAHPQELAAARTLAHWQNAAIDQLIFQPFRQLFRELYPLNRAEQTNRFESNRYAGLPIKRKQGMVLLSQRGWKQHGFGQLRRSFQRSPIQAEVDLDGEPGNPSRPEPLTFGLVRFWLPGQAVPLPLHETPPIMFSEINRDLDFVASVAHGGDDDQSGRAVLLQARVVIVEQLVRRHSLGNVAIQSPYIYIQGVLTDYTVHLASGTIHQEAGGAIHIPRSALPAMAEARLFDADDKLIGELLAKIHFLAHDEQLDNPVVLAQIVRRPG